MTRPTIIGGSFPYLQGTLGGSVGDPEGAPPTPSCCDTSTPPPDRALEENGAHAFRKGIGGTPTYVQHKTNAAFGSGVTVTLDAPPTAGNLLVVWRSHRGTAGTTPTGWTAHPDGSVEATGFGSDTGWMFYKISDGTETSITSSAGSGDWNAATVVEFAGTLTLDDSNENTGSSADILTGSVTPTSGSDGVIIGGAAIRVNDGAGKSVTPTSGWTELADQMLNGGHPLHWMAYQIVTNASGSYNPGGTCTVSASFGGQTLAFSAGNAIWGIIAPLVVDGDDATYETTTGEDAHLVDLGAAFRIASARLRIATETSGSKTYRIWGANEFDLSDLTEVGSTTFTATGSFTAQDVAFTLDFSTAYRYFVLTGDDETRRVYAFELFEATLATNHEHDHGILTGRDVADQHPASAVTFTPAGSVAATDVQAAIAEVDGDVTAHVADTTDAHDASAISVLDAGGNFTGTDVEAVLAELVGSGGEDTSYVEVAATGATETVDCSVARTYDLTFDQDCTLTLTGSVNDETHYLTILIRESGAGGWDITWPGSVTWMGTPVVLTTSDVQIVNLLTVDGGANWIATAGATETLVANLDDLGDVVITSPSEGHEIRYRSGSWVNEARTATRWEVVLTGSAPPEPVTNDAETDWLYAEV